MEKKITATRVHCVVLPFPGQGHLNPMLHFCKLLQHEGVRVTLVTTLSSLKSLQNIPSSIAVETISDGFDNGGVEEAGGYKAYLDRFLKIGPKSLVELLQKLSTSCDHVDCVIYDAVFPWALDVSKRFGIVGVSFLTQNMLVNSIYYHVHLGKLQVPLTQNEISLSPLPKLQLRDIPSFFFFTHEDNPPLLDLLVGQFSNIDKADWILCNSFYEMEKEVVDWTMKKIWSKFRTIGPCMPFMFSDKQPKDDGVAHFKNSDDTLKWLEDKPKHSVVYVSFGTMKTVDEEQIQELASGLRESGSYFLWVVKASEESKLPKDFEKKSEKGLVVTWCSQLKVLAHEAIGCFVTHCGWNSTLEALSLGVPMIAMPQWSDQSTNAKQIVDVWKVGIRGRVDEKKIVRQEVLKHCISEIMEGERGKEVKCNVKQWKTLAAEAVGEGGSSSKNVIEFVNSLFNLQAQHAMDTN